MKEDVEGCKGILANEADTAEVGGHQNHQLASNSSKNNKGKLGSIKYQVNIHMYIVCSNVSFVNCNTISRREAMATQITLSVRTSDLKFNLRK